MPSPWRGGLSQFGNDVTRSPSYVVGDLAYLTSVVTWPENTLFHTRTAKRGGRHNTAPT